MFFFFNDTATTEIYTLSLHDALPISVLLALVVIAVWEEFGRARVTVESEANALAEIFWLAHRLPEPEGRELQELCRSYAEEVVNVGWPLMEQGRTPSLERSQERSEER